MFAQLRPPGGFPEQFAPYAEPLSRVLAFVVALTFVYALGRLFVLPVLVRVVRSRNRYNPTLVSATETYSRVLLVAVATLTGLAAAGWLRPVLGTNSAIVIAALTFALSVAGQEVFGSLVSGFFLVADPDFNVGDFIRWSDGQGVVEAVDFRVTRVRTPDNETVTVPNTALTTNALTRPFGRDHYRITQRVVVPYDEDTERALLVLQQLAANFDRVVDDPRPNVLAVELAEDGIVLEAQLWVDDPARGDVGEVHSDFRRAVRRQFADAGLTLSPASQRELSGELAVERPSRRSGSGPPGSLEHQTDGGRSEDGRSEDDGREE